MINYDVGYIYMSMMIYIYFLFFMHDIINILLLFLYNYIIALSILDLDEMISAYDTQEFTPFGRGYVLRHPGEFQIQVQNMNNVDHASQLLKSFHDFSLYDSNFSKVCCLFGSFFIYLQKLCIKACLLFDVF